uniref:Secreted protein n=1 Tax=Haemonchus contortus TaxID=6289 RepID=A0A7I4YNH1_HAECO
MMRPRNSLVVIALILQVDPSHPCIFSNYCRPYNSGNMLGFYLFRHLPPRK